ENEKGDGNGKKRLKNRRCRRYVFRDILRIICNLFLILILFSSVCLELSSQHVRSKTWSKLQVRKGKNSPHRQPSPLRISSCRQRPWPHMEHAACRSRPSSAHQESCQPVQTRHRHSQQ